MSQKPKSQKPSPEVHPRVSRRRFSTDYKRRIVQEAGQCQDGELGALLTREGLYHSQLTATQSKQASACLF